MDSISLRIFSLVWTISFNFRRGTWLLILCYFRHRKRVYLWRWVIWLGTIIISWVWIIMSWPISVRIIMIIFLLLRWYVSSFKLLKLRWLFIKFRRLLSSLYICVSSWFLGLLSSLQLLTTRFLKLIITCYDVFVHILGVILLLDQNFSLLLKSLDYGLVLLIICFVCTLFSLVILKIFRFPFSILRVKWLLTIRGRF